MTKYITLVSHRGKKYFHVNLIGHIFFYKKFNNQNHSKKKNLVTLENSISM